MTTKIAHAVEGFGLDVAIHAPGPAHRHCFAALRNCNYYEMGLVHPKLKAIQATHLQGWLHRRAGLGGQQGPRVGAAGAGVGGG
jgi:L-alanine-DL-glutamate epimerase-like enolase superfamily enzyme